MSEKLYSWLFRLYPSRFREAYGEEALQLLRDRLRDEPGFFLRLRLWRDLLFDFALSLPRQYSRSQPALAATPGAPMFVLIDSQPLRPQRWCAGALLTLLAAFALISVARWGHPRPPDLLSHFMPGQVGPNFPHGPAPKMPAPETKSNGSSGLTHQNCALEELEILPHNIGYLKLDSFPEPSACLAVSTDALDAVNRADAVIIDLRENRGGYSGTVSLPVSHADEPVYVLTSHRSSSAAARFAYTLKVSKRAVLIGEESAGVEPDVQVAAEDALVTAQRLAEDRLRRK